MEGDELADLVADAAKGVLDGHLVSAALAQKGHYPAINPLSSISRASDRLAESMSAARRSVLTLLSRWTRPRNVDRRLRPRKQPGCRHRPCAQG